MANGTDLSDFGSFRGRFYGACPAGMGWSKSRQDAAPTFLLAAVGGSCGRFPWERRPAAIQSQSRLQGAPTRRCALSHCHWSYGGFLSRGRFAEPFPSLGFAGATFACAMRLRFAGVLGWRMAGEFRFNFFSCLPMTSHARYRARQPAQKPAGSRHRCVRAVSIAALNPPVGLFLQGETSNAKCSSRG